MDKIHFLLKSRSSNTISVFYPFWNEIKMSKNWETWLKFYQNTFNFRGFSLKNPITKIKRANYTCFYVVLRRIEKCLFLLAGSFIKVGKFSSWIAISSCKTCKKAPEALRSAVNICNYSSRIHERKLFCMNNILKKIVLHDLPLDD